MTGRSVRERQQPPSLERQEIMLRRWSGSVNALWIGLESQAAEFYDAPIVMSAG